MAGPVLVSACLLGCKCRYDGGSRRHAGLVERLAPGQVIPVCPEQLGGLPVPRPPAEIQGGDGGDVLAGRARVVSRPGQDVTAAYLAGAAAALSLAGEAGATAAILQDRSPACGGERIYDGSFSNTLRPGRGVAAALLAAHGLKLYTPETYLGREREK